MSDCIYQLIYHRGLRGIWWMVASCVCLTCRKYFFTQNGNLKKRKKLKKENTIKKRKWTTAAAYGLYLGNRLEAIWPFGSKICSDRSPTHSTLWQVREKTCSDQDSKHLSALECRRHISEERWIGKNCNHERVSPAMRCWNRARYLNGNLKNSKYICFLLRLSRGEPQWSRWLIMYLARWC